MDAHTLKTMLESRKTKVKVWYDKTNKIHFVVTSYSEFLKEYSITFSGITIWFDRFRYSYENDQLTLINGSRHIATLNGDLK